MFAAEDRVGTVLAEISGIPRCADLLLAQFGAAAA